MFTWHGTNSILSRYCSQSLHTDWIWEILQRQPAYILCLWLSVLGFQTVQPGVNLSCYCNVGFTTLMSLQGISKCEPATGITCALPALSPPLKQAYPVRSMQSGARGGEDLP